MLGIEIRQTNHTYRGLSKAYRPYSRSTVDLGDPCNLTEFFQKMAHTPMWPTRPKLALAA